MRMGMGMGMERVWGNGVVVQVCGDTCTTYIPNTDCVHARMYQHSRPQYAWMCISPHLDHSVLQITQDLRYRISNNIHALPWISVSWAPVYLLDET